MSASKLCDSMWLDILHSFFLLYSLSTPFLSSLSLCHLLLSFLCHCLLSPPPPLPPSSPSHSPSPLSLPPLLPPSPPSLIIRLYFSRLV